MNKYSLGRKLLFVVVTVFGMNMPGIEAFSFSPVVDWAQTTSAAVASVPGAIARQAVVAKDAVMGATKFAGGAFAPVVDLAKTTSAAVASAPGAIARQAVVAKDAVIGATKSAGGAIVRAPGMAGRAVSSVVKNAYTAVPAKDKLLVLAALGAGSYGYWRSFKNFNKRFDKYNDLFDVPFRMEDSYQLSTWNMGRWTDFKSLKANKKAVKSMLVADVFNGTLQVKNADGSLRALSSISEVQEVISKEIKELIALQKDLEKTYLVFGKTFTKDGFGIVRDYKALCGIGSAQQQVPSYAMQDWSSANYKTIDTSMREQVCINRWWHWFTQPMHGSAARLWWQAFQLRFRLELLKEIAGEIQGEKNQVVAVSPSQNVINLGVVTNVS